MRDVFWQPSGAAPAGLGRTKPLAKPRADLQQTGAPEPAITRTEPPTHVVDAYQRGDFATVGAAIKAAKPGDRILVRPGLYEEGLVVDKPLEILGDGPVSEIEIRARGASPVQFAATIGRIANLTLRQAGGTVARASVDIRQGRLDLEGCDISSQSASCVIIFDGADPRLRRNKIHDSKGNGVYILDNGLGTLEDNDITGNTHAGVEIKKGADPTIRRNRISHNHTGVHVHDNGLGTLEDNDITSNAESGVVAQAGGNPTVRRNRISNNTVGIFVFGGGLGTLEDNEVSSNTNSGVVIDTSGNPTMRRNEIHRNGDAGVWITNGGHGILEKNDLTGNTNESLVIDQDCLGNAILRDNKE